MTAPSPNILWIVTTQWRAQATGYAGDPNARTPHLDRLATESVNYTQAVTPHPFGPFARAAMLTGVPSPENGVSDYFDPLPRDARTVAHSLGARGYATAFFGKWHLFQRDRRAELVGSAHAKIIVPPEWRGGFEFWEGFESGFLLNDPWLHGTRLPSPQQFPGYQSDVVCGRAGDWIVEFGGRRAPFGERRPEEDEPSLLRAGREGRRPGGGTRENGGRPSPRPPASGNHDRTPPWFCVVSLEPPHPPYDAPVPGGGKKWEPRAIILPANVPRGDPVEATARRELAGYYAHLEATDRAIGGLLARVPGESTVVVFTSVHGDMHGAHGRFRKGWPHEESVRVPLLVRGAHQEGSGLGVQSSALVSLLDLPRWTLAWAEARQPRTLNPEPKTEMQRISMPSVVRLPHQCDRVWRGVRTRTRKLVLAGGGAPWLFFDLERDPDEIHNLSGDLGRAREMAALRRLL
jgi:arylsulfatase A-like enzyme